MRIQYLAYQIFLSLSIFILTCCSDDFQHPGGTASHAGEACITYSVADENGTRQLSGLRCETAVGHAYFLFFSKDGEFIDYAIAADDVDNSGMMKFDIPASLAQNVNYSLIALANADDFTPAGYDDFGDYLQSFSSLSLTLDDRRLLLHCKSPMTPLSIESLPMMASLKDNSSFSFSRVGNAMKVRGSLDFKRLVARIDVTNNVSDSLQLQGIGLCNWRDSYAPLSETSDIEGNIKGVLSDADALCDFTDISNNSQGAETAPVFYSFPYASREAGQGDRTTTALMLKAIYGDNTDISYYRVNVGLKDSFSELKTNHRYNIVVNSVKARGKDTPLEAYETTAQSPIEGPAFTLEKCPESEADCTHLEEFVQATATTDGKIVIDGFEPDSFNSFIDIPFRLDVSESLGSDVLVSVSSSLEWPLEGAVSKSCCKNVYYYSPESFKYGSVVDAGNSVVATLPTATQTLSKNSTFYISVGAMAPDDPAINRTLTLSANGKTVSYDIIVRPSKVIINDVIMNLNNKNYLIADRNYQCYQNFKEYNGSNGSSLSNWDGGVRKQAYYYCSFKDMKIPGKASESAAENVANETYHSEMLGYNALYGSADSYQPRRSQWTDINKCDNTDCDSPFYSTSELNNWGRMTTPIIKELANRMKVSKMRTFLMSDLNAIDSDKSEIPVCCYFPYYNSDSNTMDTGESDWGYYAAAGYSNDFNYLVAIRLVRCTNVGLEYVSVKSNATTSRGCLRPVRVLDATQYKKYKDKYLGYGGAGTLKLKACEPDKRE